MNYDAYYISSCFRCSHRLVDCAARLAAAPDVGRADGALHRVLPLRRPDEVT